MSDEKARSLFLDAGMAFPDIPEELAARLQERGQPLFSTRRLAMSPHDLQHYVTESGDTQVKDFAVLAHSGHGDNSYAIQYYLAGWRRRRLVGSAWSRRDWSGAASRLVVRDHAVPPTPILFGRAAIHYCQHLPPGALDTPIQASIIGATRTTARETWLASGSCAAAI